ncbi:DUF2865 domain-containing protein [Methylocystis sp. MJC1]|uniref:DUF2865 domain-containing protein n=1 Tax=Methylocystis sp. MJC1 TaxID=2654282 RepID=UPI001FF04CDA|nr:DUF2865 domain-containing protein [Methylocystis sp. MJC1]KAF2992790.1 hypothetical protein MJC1_00369 [Methylocystis sp. MJC1]UZX13186.1 DUF2865 domain-containing protein [Methylocystis sp. MJC1]
MPRKIDRRREKADMLEPPAILKLGRLTTIVAPGRQPEHEMRPTLGPTTTRIFLALALGALLFLPGGSARAESAYCTDLRAQIAKAGAEGMAARYRAAAAKQRGEYARLAAKGRAMGCDREQFLFFGNPPPAQCSPISARLSSLQGSIAAYEQGAADDSQRQALMARYEVDCRNQRVAAREPEPKSFFEELFGVRQPEPGAGYREAPVEPGYETLDPNYDGEGQMADGRPQGGPMAICVRTCDGGFFPITYSARSGQLDDLNTLCKAMCPGTEAKLYTQSQGKGLESAISIDGEAYADLPNAHKFEKNYDASCGCKPKGQSWTEALAEAERILAERNKKDQMVTAEQAEQLSRPILPGDPRAKKPALSLPPGPAEASAGLRGAEGSVTTGGPEVFRDIIGPDGVKRRVRVVAPTL